MKAFIRNPFLLPALIAGLGLIRAGRVPAQTFTILHSFTATSGPGPYPYYTNSDGAFPNDIGRLILTNNTLYGTAAGGGSSGHHESCFTGGVKHCFSGAGCHRRAGRSYQSHLRSPEVLPVKQVILANRPHHAASAGQSLQNHARPLGHGADDVHQIPRGGGRRLNIHNTSEVLFLLCANTDPQRDSIFHQRLVRLARPRHQRNRQRQQTRR